MTKAAQTTKPENDTPPKSIFGVIVHSFFIVPFFIAVFSVLLLLSVRMLTMEEQTVYDILNDVKTGGTTKRWQAAFELSKILANPDVIPDDERFGQELIHAFKEAQHDDDRVRQYLALAMGRTGLSRFVDPLMEGLDDQSEDNLYAIIYALGLLQDSRALPALYEYLDHPQARIRLAAVMAVGNIGDASSEKYLKSGLNDSDSNVQWDAAVALAKIGSDAGVGILSRMLDRSYLNNFPAVDQNEQNHILLVVIQSASGLKNKTLREKIRYLAENDGNMQIRRAAMEVVE
jgi:HEAT repeat protein